MGGFVFGGPNSRGFDSRWMVRYTPFLTPRGLDKQPWAQAWAAPPSDGRRGGTGSTSGPRTRPVSGASVGRPTGAWGGRAHAAGRAMSYTNGVHVSISSEWHSGFSLKNILEIPWWRAPLLLYPHLTGAWLAHFKIHTVSFGRLAVLLTHLGVSACLLGLGHNHVRVVDKWWCTNKQLLIKPWQKYWFQKCLLSFKKITNPLSCLNEPTNFWLNAQCCANGDKNLNRKTRMRPKRG